MKQTPAKEPIPLESAGPTGPSTQHGGSCKRGVQRSDIASSMVTQYADEELLEVPDTLIDKKQPDKTRNEQTRTITGLYVCVAGSPKGWRRQGCGHDDEPDQDVLGNRNG